MLRGHVRRPGRGGGPVNGGDETFPAALDQWTPKDWQEYRRRTEDGEGSVRTIDAITRRRTREPETSR
jgi:hypothetical protein